MGELIESAGEDTFKMAENILKGGEYIPSNFKGKPHELEAAIRTGRELGFSPMVSMRSLYIVQGKVGIYYDASVGLLRKRGYIIRWEKTDAADKQNSSFTRIEVLRSMIFFAHLIEFTCP